MRGSLMSYAKRSDRVRPKCYTDWLDRARISYKSLCQPHQTAHYRHDARMVVFPQNDMEAVCLGLLEGPLGHVAQDYVVRRLKYKLFRVDPALSVHPVVVRDRWDHGDDDLVSMWVDGPDLCFGPLKIMLNGCVSYLSAMRFCIADENIDWDEVADWLYEATW